MKSFVLITLIYLASIAVISPFKEYAVNDDWDFITHVKNFRSGDFTKNSLIDSSFILQGFLGVGWSYIFGLSYPSLKALTVLVTILTIFGVYKILKHFKLPDLHIFIGLGVFLFNPFVYPFSFTFMTEGYFLCLAIWSLYFHLKYIDSKNARLLMLTFGLSGLSLLIRQLGLVLFPAHFALLFFYDLKNIRKIFQYYIAGLLFFSFCILVVFMWPQYNSDFEKPSQILTRTLSKPNLLIAQMKELPYVLPYLGFCIAVFTLPLFYTLTRKSKIAVLAGVVLLFNMFYVVNIFKVGNVLYPEGLLIKNNYQTHINLFNNIPFKVLINTALLLSCGTAICFLIENRSQLKNKLFVAPLILSFAMIIPIALQYGYFDRYLVNGLVMLSIFFQLFAFSTKKINKSIILLQFIMLGLYCFYVFTHSYDFHKGTQLQWAQAAKLKQVNNIGNRIFLSDTYSKYFSTYFKSNGPDVDRAMPKGIAYECYVQKDYIFGETNIIGNFLNRINKSKTINTYVVNPVIYNSATTSGYRSPTKDPNKIIFQDSYFSPLESLIGNTSIIVTYCNEKL